MARSHFCALWLVAAGVAGCGGNDPPPGSSAPVGRPANAAEAAAQNQATAPPIEARDVAVLVVEQTASSLRVTSSARRPRASFGPSASWNGSGAATHKWVLRGPHGDAIAMGDIVARGALEAPPSASKGVPAAHVPQDVISFTAKVPQPAAGEAIEITPVGGSALVARWP